ncbi:MAG: hypothetical protein HYR67_11175 [Bacteroidetes bacterium]|nr:hypothetical protein [Bacteroidota bacterium]
MTKILDSLGAILVALAFMAFGVEHFVFQVFVTGRPPAWPATLPGEHLISYASGILIFSSGIAILTRRGWQFPFFAGLLILLWSGLRNIYELVTRLDYGVILTSTNKSLTIGGCALVMAAMLNSKTERGLIGKAIEPEKYFVGIFLFTAGIQHFIFAEFVKHLIPAWIPSPIFWTYFAGVALAAGGLGIVTGIKAQLAATLSGLMIFIWLLVLHLPRALEFNNVNEWAAVAEATTVSGILLVIAPRLSDSRRKKT